MKSNPAVPVEMLKKVHNLLKSGISIEDVVDRLRTETVPRGYPIHPWLSGVCVIITCTKLLCIIYAERACGVCLSDVKAWVKCLCARAAYTDL